MTRPDDRIEDGRALEAGAWCARLAERRITPEERSRFAVWIAAPGNREALDRAISVWRSFEGRDGDPDLLELRREALEGLWRAGANSMRSRLRGRRGVAVAVALFVFAAIGAGVGARYLPQVYQTGVGERRVVLLSDGSKISLDASTRVDVRYLDNRRELWLKRGRANFTVIKSPLRPFSVVAADKIVVATGTEFSVELLRKQVRVVLYEGHVAVLQGDSGASARPVPLIPQQDSAKPQPAEQALTPGRQLIAAIDARAAEVAPADPGRSLSWEAGQLYFRDEPLALAVERVNRYSHEKLEVADAEAGRVLVSGVFAAGDTDAFIEGMTTIFPVRVVETPAGKAFFLSSHSEHPARSSVLPR